MKKFLEILKKCPLFYNVDEQKLPIMLNCLGAKVDVYDKKYTIMSEGSGAKYIGIVLSGSAQITQVDFYGNRTIVGNVMPSELFGEEFACAESESMPVSIIANEPSEIMLINCTHILHTCHNNCEFHQQLIFNLMRELAIKTISFHQKIEITCKRTTREKLMEYLNSMQKKTGKSSFEIPFDRQELADYLEVDRSGLSAQISKLKAEGVIDSHKKHFTIL